MKLHFSATSDAPKHRVQDWFFRFILCGLGAFVQPIKDALSDIPTNSAVFLSAGGKLFWLMPFLVYPHLFNTFPDYYSAFKQSAPEWIWALSILALMCVDLFVLMRKSYVGQVGCLILGALYWLFVARQISAGVPHGFLNIPAAPFAGVCFGSGLACMVANYRLISTHKATMDAHNMLILGKQVELARRSGEGWAQAPSASTNQNAEKGPEQGPLDRESRSANSDYAAAPSLI